MNGHPNEVCQVCRVLGPPPHRLVTLLAWMAAHKLLLLPLNHG